jgi:hypothetical protein
LSLERFTLQKVVDGSGLFPEGIIKRAIQPWGMVDAARLYRAKPFLNSGLLLLRWSIRV